MYYTVPAAEISNRIANLQKVLREKKLDGGLVGSNVNLFYLTGTLQSGFLYVPAAGEPLFFLRKNLERAQKESPLKNVVPFKKLEELPELLADFNLNLPKRLALEMGSMTAKEYLRFLKIFGEVEVHDLTRLLRELRMVKSDYEIQMMKASAKKQALVYEAIPKLLRPGMTDLELAAKIESFSRKEGHIGLVRFFGNNQEFYFGQILAGENGLVPNGYDTTLGGQGLNPAFPTGVANVEIKAHQPILVDYAGNYNGYNVDLTRVFSLGTLEEKLLFAYKVAVEIEAEIAEKAKPGVSCEELYHWAKDLAKKYNLEDHFMGYYQQAPFVGHGLGLEMNELPVLAPGFTTQLKPGMALAVEPKFAFPGLGVVGIEDTFVVKERGLKKITMASEEIIIV